MADFDVVRVAEFNLELLEGELAEAKTVEEQNKIMAEIEEAKKDLENARKAVDRP